MRLRSLIGAVCGALLMLTPPASAQVRVTGYGDADLDALIRNALASHPLMITHDTLVGAHDTIHSNVVVVKARFILEGTIEGDLTAFGANVYLRPSARVSGQVLNVVGGLYASELAKSGSIEDRPVAPYRISSDQNGYIVEGMIKRPSLKLLGGVRMPEYNRVDGLRVEAGPSLLLPHVAGVEPVVTAAVGYATARKDVILRGELLLKRGRSSLAFAREANETFTNEEWIRPAFNNSIAFLWNGHDYRNYYQADRTYVEFRRTLEHGTRTTEYWLRGQSELASSLVARNPFVIWKADSVRYNDPVPESRIESAFLGLRTFWQGRASAADLSGQLEFAARSWTNSDYGFGAYRVKAQYAFKAIANHTMEVTANFRGPLPGTETLPQQRWTFVGGSNTLYTFRLNEFRGDRLAFVQTEYRIPFNQRLMVPLLGRPTLRFMHNIGMAWSDDVHRDFEQNVGARLQFPFVYARVVTNPRKVSDKVLFDFGVSWQPKSYPWEKAAPAK